MAERRLTTSERRLRRVTAEEPDQGPRGILELFREEQEQPDADAPLAREFDADDILLVGDPPGRSRHRCVLARLGGGAEPHFADHENAFARSTGGQDLLWKFTLPGSIRTEVLRRLDAFNLNAYSLFQTEEKMLETLALREIDLLDG